MSNWYKFKYVCAACEAVHFYLPSRGCAACGHKVIRKQVNGAEAARRKKIKDDANIEEPLVGPEEGEEPVKPVRRKRKIIAKSVRGKTTKGNNKSKDNKPKDDD